MRKVIVFICLSFLGACSNSAEMPKEVLPVSKMKLVVWDMSLADNLASEKYILNKDSQRIMVTGLYQKIFNLHKISKTVFYNSYAYYEMHPVVLQTLFDSVSAYGERQKGKAFQKIHNVPQAMK